MTDRELLELAAKAAGMETCWDQPRGARTGFLRARVIGSGDAFPIWDPLQNDGEALRLAVALGIDIEWRADGRVAAYRHANSNGYCFTAFESSREDRVANVRRAIVRAAAEIGKDEK